MAEDTNQGTNLERNSAGGLNDPHSRRLFLRAAVIGTAGVAGAAGVAGVALARGGKSPTILGNVLGAHHYPSTPPSGSMGFQETGQKTAGHCVTTYGKPGNGSVENYIIFLASNVPAGNYTFTLSFQVNGLPVAGTTLTESSAPWKLKAPSQIHANVVAANTGSTCPINDPTPGNAYSEFSDIVTNPIQVSSTSDVVIYMHVTYVGTPASTDTSTFNGTLTGPVTVTGSEMVHAN